MASTSRHLRPQNFVLSAAKEPSSNLNEPRVLSVGTAVPVAVIAQEQARSLTCTLFATGFKDIERLISVFDNGQVMTRHLAAPIELFETEHPWAEKNALLAFGNISSVSVLFVLERFMRRWAQLPAGEIGAISAMGPEFSVEHAFFRT